MYIFNRITGICRRYLSEDIQICAYRYTCWYQIMTVYRVIPLSTWLPAVTPQHRAVGSHNCSVWGHTLLGFGIPGIHRNHKKTSLVVQFRMEYTMVYHWYTRYTVWYTIFKILILQ